MKLEFVAKNVKVLNIVKNENDGIEWYSAVIMQGMNVNANVTVDKNAVPDIKENQVYNMIMTVSENPKAYRNGTGAYIENKFKIVGIEKKASN